MKRCIRPLVFLAPALAFAHPMGNFSVSHYSRIEVTGAGIRIRYVLDLAEIPTFQLLQQWQLDAASPRAGLERHAAAQAREWAGNLKFELDGRAIVPRFERSSMVIDKGAGGMAIMRVISEWMAPAGPAGAGSLRYEDGNFPDRAGWKEIVIVAGKDAAILQASPSGTDRSHELTAYPQDPLLAPPQDLTAAVSWRSTAPVTTAAVPSPSAPAPAAPETAPAAAAAETAPAVSAIQPGQSAPGMVVRGDYLSRLLHQGEIGWGMMLVGMVVAFGLGAIHALSPGHGKTIVAAYLVGARGTARHAIFLGGMVTFTHTISVFFLGLVTLFLSRYVLPEKIYPVLGAISGLSIVWIGALLLYKRARVAFGHGTHHHHHHDSHDHGDGHVHSHAPEGATVGAAHHAVGLVHDHGDGHSHSHAPEVGTGVAHHHAGGLVHDHGDGHVHSHAPEVGTGVAHHHAGGLVHDHGDGHMHSHTPEVGTGVAHHHAGGQVHDHGDGHVHSNAPEVGTGVAHHHAVGLVHDHGDGHVHGHAPEGATVGAAHHAGGLVHDHGDGHVHSNAPEGATFAAAHHAVGLVHDHGDGHSHSHGPEVGTGVAHHHAGGLVHDHGDGHVHSHVPEGEINIASLIALGASGGLVPCPSALVLLLSSVALGRVGLGLTLLVAFSCGLAVVLSSIGLVVLYAKNLLPDDTNRARNAAFRYLPVASAAVIVCAGILMTGVALGIIRPFAGV